MPRTPGSTAPLSFFAWLYAGVGALAASAAGHALGGLLGAVCAVGVGVGLVLAISGLIGKRAAGRACPNCGYGMEGVPGRRCPECGREAGAESWLRSPRRRRRGMAWAGAAMLALFGTGTVMSAQAFELWGLAPRWVVVWGFENGMQGAATRIDLEEQYNSLAGFDDQQIKAVVRRYAAIAQQSRRMWDAHVATEMILKYGDAFDRDLAPLLRDVTAGVAADTHMGSIALDSVRSQISRVSRERVADSPSACQVLANICTDSSVHPTIRLAYLEWLSSSRACDGFGLVEAAIAKCERDPDTAVHDAALVARQRVDAGRVKGR